MVTGVLVAAVAWRQMLLAYALIPALAAALGIWAFRNIGWTPKTHREASSRRWQLTGRLLRNRLLWGMATVYGLRAMALVALLTTLPLYLHSELGLTPAWRGLHIGLLIAIGLVTKPAVGHLSDRLGRKAVLAPALGWSCLMALLLVVFEHGAPFTVVVALLGVFLYPDQPVLTAAVFDLFDGTVAATALGVVSFAAVVMSTVSPLVAGAMYQAVGFHAVAYYTAGLLGAAGLIFVLLPLARFQGGGSP